MLQKPSHTPSNITMKKSSGIRETLEFVAVFGNKRVQLRHIHSVTRTI